MLKRDCIWPPNFSIYRHASFKLWRQEFYWIIINDQYDGNFWYNTTTNTIYCVCIKYDMQEWSLCLSLCAVLCVCITYSIMLYMCVYIVWCTTVLYYCSLFFIILYFIYMYNNECAVKDAFIAHTCSCYGNGWWH